MLKKSKLVIAILSCMTVAGAYAAQFGAGIDEATEQMRHEAAAEQHQSQQNALSAEDMAYAFIDDAAEKKILDEGQGWNEQAQTYVVVGTAEYKADIGSSDFIKMRAMKAIEAGLNAKSEIARFIRTEMSVNNMVTMPETKLNTEFDQKLAALQQKLQQKTAAYERALKEVNQAQEAGPIDIGVLMQEGIVEGLKNAGITIDLKRLSSEHSQRLQKAQQELLALQAEIDEIKAMGEQLRGSLRQENTSRIEALAYMPLVGVTTIGQWESLIDDTYQLAVVMTWSPRQERFVRAMIEGKSLEIPQRGSESLGDFIRANDWSTAIGGRKHLDDQGNYSILGVGAWPIVGKGSAARREAEGHARLLATSNIALSLFGDIRSHEIAQQKTQELASGIEGPETQVVSNMAQEISESVNRIQLQGLEQRLMRKMKHPISGQDMMVAVYSYGVKQSEIAKEMEKVNWQGAETVERANDRSLGVKAGLQESFKKTADDPAAYQAGKAEGLNGQASPASSSQTQSQKPTQAGGQRQVQGAGTSAGGFLY